MEQQTDDRQRGAPSLSEQLLNASTPWLDRVVAMERAALNSTRGTPMPMEEFVRQAALLGLSVSPMSGSRFDLRPPEIIARDGFTPKDDAKGVSILGHTEWRGNLVSGTELGTAAVALGLSLARPKETGALATAEPQNYEELLAFAQFKDLYAEAQRIIAEPLDPRTVTTAQLDDLSRALYISGEIERIHLEKFGVKPSQPVEQVHCMFEYTFNDVPAVPVFGIPGMPFPDQRELLTQTIPSGAIGQVRVVTVTRYWALDRDLSVLSAAAMTLADGSSARPVVKFGEWAPLDGGLSALKVPTSPMTPAPQE